MPRYLPLFTLTIGLLTIGCSAPPPGPDPSSFFRDCDLAREYDTAQTKADAFGMSFSNDFQTNAKDGISWRKVALSFCGRQKQAELYMKEFHAAVVKRAQESGATLTEGDKLAEDARTWTIRYTTGPHSGTITATRDDGRKEGPCMDKGLHEYGVKVAWEERLAEAK